MGRPGAGAGGGDSRPPCQGRRAGAAPAPAGGALGLALGCVIKGNIASDGERIYHVPGGGFHERTSIDAARGER